VNADTLRAWSHLSLEQRVKYFHRQFPEITISAFTLWSIYRKHGIRYKVIHKVKKVIDYQVPSNMRLFETMERLLKLVTDHKQKLVFLDEAVFTFNTFTGKAWSKSYSSLTVVEKKLNIKPVAFIAAVSEDHGLESYMLHPKSIN
jgi:hypothetical protein